MKCEILSGVPQGLFLLFLVYINGITELPILPKDLSSNCLLMILSLQTYYTAIDYALLQCDIDHIYSLSQKKKNLMQNAN